MFLLSAVAPWKRALFAHQRLSVTLPLWVAPLATSRNAETFYRDRRCQHHCSQPGPWKGLTFPACIQHRLGLRLLSAEWRHSSSAAVPLAFMPLVLRSLSLEIPRKPQNQKTFLLVDWLSDGFEKGKPVFFPFRLFSVYSLCLAWALLPIAHSPWKIQTLIINYASVRKRRKQVSFANPGDIPIQSLGLEPWAQLRLRPWAPAILVPQFLSQDTYW